MDSGRTMECHVRLDSDESANRRYPEMGICSLVMKWLYIVLIVVTFPFSWYFCMLMVPEFERAVIYRSGRLIKGGTKGPGIFFHIPCMDSYYRVDLRTVTFIAPPQQILTKDSVTVEVEAVVYYHVTHPSAAVTNVADCVTSTETLAVATLRTVLGTKLLAEVLAQREEMARAMEVLLDEATRQWGVKVERVEMRNLRLPYELQRPMASEAEAWRRATARVTAAEGELKASSALRGAVNVMGGTATAMDLRYQQTLTTVAAQKSSDIVPQFMELFRMMNSEKDHKASFLQTSPLVSHQRTLITFHGGTFKRAAAALVMFFFFFLFIRLLIH